MARNAKQNRPPATPRTWFFRIAGLLVFIALLGFGWDYAWRHGAKLLDAEATRLITQSNDAGREIECTNRHIEGFPFRIGIFCDAVSLYGVREGISIRAGALRSAAQFYQPGHVIVEMDGPLTASAGDSGEHVARWHSLRASANVGLDGIRRVSVQARDLDYSAHPPDAQPGLIARVDDAELHLRPNPEEAGAIDLAFLFGKAELEPATGAPLPAFALSGDLRLDNMRDELRPGFDLLAHLRDKGLAGRIRRAQFAPIDGGDVAVSGTFEIARNGLLSAVLDFESADPSGLIAFLARVFPDRADMWDQVGQAVALLAAGRGEKKITVEIDRGAVFVGLFRIADIPPLF